MPPKKMPMKVGRIPSAPMSKKETERMMKEKASKKNPNAPKKRKAK